MKLTPPKNTTFWASILLVALGLIGALVPNVPIVSVYPFWFVFIGYVVLFFGLILKGF